MANIIYFWSVILFVCNYYCSLVFSSFLGILVFLLFFQFVYIIWNCCVCFCIFKI